MRRNTIETVLGGVVIVVAGFFLVFAYTSADLRRVDGYEVTANFSSVGGLQSGSDVRISGVKVGTVTSQTLDPSTYLAVGIPVQFHVAYIPIISCCDCASIDSRSRQHPCSRTC